MKRGRCVLIGITDRAMPHYLDGRPRDRRVKYRTWRNMGRVYPYASSKRNGS